MNINKNVYMNVFNIDKKQVRIQTQINTWSRNSDRCIQ